MHLNQETIKLIRTMKSYLLSLCGILFLQFAFSQNTGLFYYTKSGVTNLSSVSGKYTVEFKDSVDLSLFQINNFKYEKLVGKCFDVEGSYGQLYSALNSVCHINPVLTTDNGTVLHMKSSLVLSWKPETSQADRNQLISNYNLVELKSNRLFSQFETQSPLSVSQMIFESDLVEYCYPSFISEIIMCDYIPNDPYFEQQWYLHNTGQLTNDGHFGTPDADIDAPEAWDLTLGSSDIVIAIIDDGVTSNHPDLPDTRQVRLPGSNMLPNDPLGTDDPSPTGGYSHGNGCAGIAAAEMDNNQGVAGIAPLCKIMPIKVYGDGIINVENDVLSEAILFEVDNGANIISNSWSLGFEDPDYSATINAAIEDAIDNDVTVLFGAGNGGASVWYPANANIEKLIAVGASDRNDVKAFYSSFGPETDIVAPSHTAKNSDIPGEAPNIWTIDSPSLNGDNPWNTGGPFSVLPVFEEELPNAGTNHLSYTGRFGGTSASTPMVAGVAALMLSVNPCLSPSQVYDILTNTAEKVGGYDYYWSDEMPGHSLELGYGRLNAFNAVQAALNTLTPGVDLYTKDTPDDFGDEPNEVSEFLWVSEDIWIRNQEEGFTNQFHENPEYSPTAPVYVYVRVRNRGCSPFIST